MIRRIEKLVRSVNRKLRQRSTQNPDFVNYDDFADVVATYRAKGVMIGQKVRLLGAIDSINPHLVSIGDYDRGRQPSARFTEIDD